MADILPDSRCKVSRGAVYGRFGIYWIPIYCASCGADCGMVPEDSINCNFAFWLCDSCFEKYGIIAGTMIEPTTAFWQRVNEEMMEKYGHLLPPEELQEVIDANSSPLASLFQQGANVKGI